MKSLLLLTVLVFGFFIPLANASVVPTFSVSSNGYNALATVHGDPNTAVELHYGNSAENINTIGTTDSNGNFSTPLSVSSYQFGCGKTAYVRVGTYQSATIPWSLNNSSCQSLALSQTNVSLNPGQSTIITATISGGLYVSSNSNPSVAGASVSGNQITITAASYGTSNLTVCTTNEMCGVINITTNAPGANAGSNLSFSQTNVEVNVGQSSVVTIYGSGNNYTIPTNSNPATVSTSLSGNVLTLTGLAFGGSNVTICQNNNQCGVVYVIVVNNPALTGTYTNNAEPTITSLNISSDNVGGEFIKAGNRLTITFNTNKPISNPLMLVGLTRVNLTGSGSGPYLGTYSVTSNNPLPLIITFSDSSGRSGRATLTLGDWSAPSNISNSPITTPTPGPRYTFSTFLGVGDNGKTVTELQKRLTELGFYHGPTNGNFGPLTEAGVTALQRANGIKSVGYVGPATRAILNQY
ncbi:peptidoglycan-binding protein [Candidatus Nomurabacteria bacterium]|nr:peptidoglycan-binding protein [Candidatus Nomurabacteria bacterium]